MNKTKEHIMPITHENYQIKPEYSHLVEYSAMDAPLIEMPDGPPDDSDSAELQIRELNIGKINELVTALRKLGSLSANRVC
jgi:hypothetical protein